MVERTASRAAEVVVADLAIMVETMVEWAMGAAMQVVVAVVTKAVAEAIRAAVAREAVDEVAAEDADALLGLGVAATASTAGPDETHPSSVHPSSTSADYRPAEAQVTQGAHVEL